MGKLERVRRPVLVTITQHSKRTGWAQTQRREAPAGLANCRLLSLRPQFLFCLGRRPFQSSRLGYDCKLGGAAFAETGLVVWVHRFWPRPLRRRPLPQALAGLPDSCSPAHVPAPNTLYPRPWEAPPPAPTVRGVAYPNLSQAGASPYPAPHPPLI